MNYAEHIAAAESLTREAEQLPNAGGSGMLAAEAIWGATAQVVNAINHARGSRRRHANNNRERRRTITYLESKYTNDEIRSGFEVALGKLHNHFYGGHLDEVELSESLESGREFIATMIELAALELAETERVEREVADEQQDAGDTPPV